MARRRVTRTPGLTVWVGVGFPPDKVAVAAGSTVLLAVLNAAALSLRPFTVMRTRLRLLWVSDQVAASEEPQGAFGIIVASEQATGQGVASVPNPGVDTDSSWMVYEPLITSFVFADATGIDADGGSIVDIDSKAMRKVNSNEDLAVMVDNTSASDGGFLWYGGRMLVKLH